MDIFNEELLKLWRSLNDCAVRYIMVGEVASCLHGYGRMTTNIEIWVDDNQDNRESLRKAFKQCDMGDYYMLKTMQIVPGWTDFRLNNGLRIDIMIQMKGLEGYTFDESLKLANIAEIETVKIPFLQINQLIANKKAVNRPKDQTDVIFLEKIKRIQEEEGLPPVS